MDEWMKQALELVKAQARVRVMNEDEIASMVQRLSVQLRNLAAGIMPQEQEAAAAPALSDPKKAIKEKSITCLECGKSFKVITKKHLAQHGLTTEEYLAKHGFPKKTPLVCKSLQRERRKKMKEMALWEKRGKKA